VFHRGINCHLKDRTMALVFVLYIY